MANRQIRRQNSGLPRLEAFTRFGSIPVVEDGIKTVINFFGSIKNSNELVRWYCEKAQATVSSTVESIIPAVKLLEVPLKRLDQIMCKSLDIVEQQIPSIYLPPQMIICTTKEYMSDNFVKPVLKKADSVKQIGTAVLENRVTNFAADKLDVAIAVADRYVDLYFPNDNIQESLSTHGENETYLNTKQGAFKAIQHGQRFSIKLKRRLTQRTIAEAKALKKQSKEAINVLIYAAELIATDPKLALEKGRQLWTYLSNEEPENQARPHNLEQLIVLLTRESARRVVHAANFTAAKASKMLSSIKTTCRQLSLQLHYIVTFLLNVPPNDIIGSKKINTDAKVERFHLVYERASFLTNTALEFLALYLSGRFEAEKITTLTLRRGTYSATHLNINALQNNLNGVY